MYIYLKTHRVTGLNYLGVTVNNPFVYKGSGKYWTAHINKHGYDVETTIIFETDCLIELREACEYYSALYSVETSKQFANLIPETGFGGMVFRKASQETKNKISAANKGKSKNKGANSPRYDKQIYKFQNGETIFEGTRYDFYKKYNLNPSKVCMLLKGEISNTKGWVRL